MKKERVITEVLNCVEFIWRRYPQLRFLQLIDILEREYKTITGNETDPFYLEDKIFLKWLKSYCLTLEVHY